MTLILPSKLVKIHLLVRLTINCVTVVVIAPDIVVVHSQ